LIHNDGFSIKKQQVSRASNPIYRNISVNNIFVAIITFGCELTMSLLDESITNIVSYQSLVVYRIV